MARETAAELVERLNEQGHTAEKATEHDGVVVTQFATCGLSERELGDEWEMYMAFNHGVNILKR